MHVTPPRPRGRKVWLAKTFIKIDEWNLRDGMKLAPSCSMRGNWFVLEYARRHMKPARFHPW